MPAGFLSPSALARLQRRAEADMAATCAVLRRGAGGTFAPAPGLAALRCEFSALSATADGASGGAVDDVTRYVVRFPPHVFPLGAGGVRPGDRLVLTHARPGLPSPLVLDVVGDQPGGAYEVTRRVVAARHDRGTPAATGVGGA